MALLVLVLVLVGSLAGSPQSTKFKHPGAIVDARNGDALPGALATAYGAKDPDAKGACPRHKDELNEDEADQQGNFTFLIPPDRSSYFAMYCSNGYQARPVPANDNSRDGSRVFPDPVKLYPTQAKLAASGIDPTTAAVVAIVRVLDEATDDLRYFRGADADGFSEAVKQLDPTSRDATTLLLERRGASSPRAGRTGLPQVAGQAVRLVLETATGNLTYFRTASRGGVESALPKLAELDRRTATLLMDRPVSLALNQERARD